MLACGKALKVLKPIVGWVAVPVMDMTAFWYRAESARPNVSVKLLAAARVISLAWPYAVQTAIEILRDRVKDDWTNEPIRRLPADVHPFSVQNK